MQTEAFHPNNWVRTAPRLAAARTRPRPRSELPPCTPGWPVREGDRSGCLTAEPRLRMRSRGVSRAASPRSHAVDDSGRSLGFHASNDLGLLISLCTHHRSSSPNHPILGNSTISTCIRLIKSSTRAHDPGRRRGKPANYTGSTEQGKGVFVLLHPSPQSLFSFDLYRASVSMQIHPESLISPADSHPTQLEARVGDLAISSTSPRCYSIACRFVERPTLEKGD
jgi:hypothetical protein